MYNKITDERWQQAQLAERKQHTFTYEEGRKHYHKTYSVYFAYLGLGFDLGGLSVTEIGPADFPALGYCKNFTNARIYEPMPSDFLKEQCLGKNIRLIESPFEANNIKHHFTTEVWLFNVMQHIIDPDKFVLMCKLVGKRIRFFEPINYPTSVYHPHSFTADDFRKWFPGSVQLYKGGSIPGFHEADCAYGTFIVK